MSGLVIVGAGPGIGLSVARRFAREGLPVGLVARSTANLASMTSALGPSGVPVATFSADCADDASLRSALEAAHRRFGEPDVVVYNAALIRPDHVGTPTDVHRSAWAVNVGGAITAAAHVVPAMARRGRGSFIVTGGMPEPKPDYVSLSLGKASQRALVALLDQQFGRSGVHIATVTVAGPVAPGTAFDPDDIAEHYWRLHRQDRPDWQLEVVHDG